ncbi:MAG: hypothetical protein J6B80_02885 [Clostridia bacterium]|nr:hypothetical protein [Clostridia bacterium]
MMSDEGRKILVKDGDSNLFDEIQMFKDECNIYNIIRRYQLGDVGVLSKVSSAYIDTLGQPKTMQEALNLSLKLKLNYDALKPEYKSQFADFNAFLKSCCDGSIVDVLKPLEKTIVKEETPSES